MSDLPLGAGALDETRVLERSPQPSGPLHRDASHESALRHTTGEARYVDDLPLPPGSLHAAVATSAVACGSLSGLELAAARAMPGVVCVLTAADIPGHNRIGPIIADEPLLAEGEISFVGQALALVVAETRAQALAGAAAVEATIEPGQPLLSIEDAVAAGAFHGEPHVIERGDLEAALAGAHVVVEGEVLTPAQDHFYLETHAALALPGEQGSVEIISSTQHPTEIQREVAAVLGLPAAMVVCSVPRMGGGFGGKESQATPWAALAALGAQVTGVPVKLRLDRGQDMRWTGQRHPFHGRYRAGFDAEGRLLALEAELVSDGGWSWDLSAPVLDRAMFHLDNAYRIDHLRFSGRVARTNLPSSTAFRGFGGPQGMVVCEHAIEAGAEALGLDPMLVRSRSFYVDGDRAPYGQQLRDVRLQRIADELLASSRYAERRAEIEAFNASQRWRKRGIGFQPVKFGISFTKSVLNQAGALVLIYTDGSVQLNHGGTEMGQGLHSKMLAVCADALGVEVAAIRAMTTATDKVPNTSATAASSGSDLNGQAVRQACETLIARMRPVAGDLLEAAPEAVRFAGGQASAGGASVSFAEVAQACWERQISLSATGYYATPGIGYDHASGRGTPFYYYAYGGCVLEVEVDLRTGEHGVRAVDILHDCGASLIPSIDRGQVEGAFVQGLGWLTMEQMLTAPDGTLLTHGPSTYKIPSVGDLPPSSDFRVNLLADAPQEGVIGGSKAVGEPPFMLGIAVISALRHAIAGVPPADSARPIKLALPATHEHVLRAVEERRR